MVYTLTIVFFVYLSWYHMLWLYQHFMELSLSERESVCVCAGVLEKPPVAQLLKNCLTFYGTRRFISMSQEPIAGPYPEPDEWSPYHLILFL
jgi:hypothetical protein